MYPQRRQRLEDNGQLYAPAALHPGATAGLDPTEKRQSFPPAGNQTLTREKSNSYLVTMVTDPCGGGSEYLHRNPYES
jgi:hypothetical protein